MKDERNGTGSSLWGLEEEPPAQAAGAHLSEGARSVRGFRTIHIFEFLMAKYTRTWS